MQQLKAVNDMKEVHVKQLTAQEKSEFIKAFERDLVESPLYSRRNQIVLDPDSKFKVIPPYYARVEIWFVLGVFVGVVGCLYATGYIS